MRVLICMFLFAVSMTAQVDHSTYEKVLQDYVSDKGVVDYTGLSEESETLRKYCTYLQSISLDDVKDKDERLALWINAYNAHTMLLIVDNYPIASIMELYDGKPWDVQWISMAGKSLSLNDIEHKIIREQFSEPRIHFALNCAAVSCPPLWNHAYTAESLDQDLEARTVAFLSDSHHNKVSRSKASVSKIFDWYKDDFGDLATYLKRYFPGKTISSISFKDYDWSLNGK